MARQPENSHERPLWSPSPERIAASAMERFRKYVRDRSGLAISDYDALHAFSVEQPERFWGLLADHLGLPFAERGEAVRSADPMPRTRWFEGSTLNYARALLYPPAVEGSGRVAPRPGAGDGGEAYPQHDRESRPFEVAGTIGADAPAIIGVTEDGAEQRLSWRELRRLVARVQAALQRAGVGRGDAVAAIAANVPETVALLLACAGLGALFSSCSPDFGPEAAAARFSQLRPKLLFASTRYRYGGKRFDTKAAVAALRSELPTLQGVVALPYPGEEGDAGQGSNDGSAPEEPTPWAEWLDAGAVSEHQIGEPITEPLPFDHPLYVLYSSGTTGLPKAMVHRAGGALLTHMKELSLHSDVGPGDVVFYFTTCGWMMWNWLVSALAVGATIVLYDGSPAYPDARATFALAERLGVTFFGTSARMLSELMAQGVQPGRDYDLSGLRTLASTGSPLSPDGFRYVYSAIGEDLHLASISGGTDIVSCFMLGVPTLPVHAGQIQRPGLGVDLRVLDEQGNDVVGEPGELVCAQPLPSMPLAFLGDEGFGRYLAAYFDVYPGLWRHGDLVERTAQGGLVVYGRSDATLNPGGVRIGTAEIYRPLERIPEVAEAVAVGKRVDADQEVWLLVTLAPGAQLDDALVQRIRSAIRKDASPRHVPRRVIDVPQLPRTRSGKSMEIAVARLVNGQTVPNLEVMANPEAVEMIEARLSALR